MLNSVHKSEFLTCPESSIRKLTGEWHNPKRHLLSATPSDTVWCLILKAAVQTLPRLHTESEGTTTLNFVNMKHKEQHFDIYSLSMKVIMESPNCAKGTKLLKLLFKETDFKFKCIKFLKIYALVEVDLTGWLLRLTASDVGQHLINVKQRITTNALPLPHGCVVMLSFLSPLFSFFFNNFPFVLCNYNWLFYNYYIQPDLP